MHLFITILMMLFANLSTAEIYSWEDKNGVTHFSESKPETPVKEMKTIQTSEQPQSLLGFEEQQTVQTIEASDIEDKLSQALFVEE